MQTPARSTPPEASGDLPKEPQPVDRWVDHVARTTAVLAVLAAISSGQYAGQFSHTILAQAEASDAWSYYQAKSIKKHLSENQIALATALAEGRPELRARLSRLQEQEAKNAKRYNDELSLLKARADQIELAKVRHQKMGDRFQYAFVVLQAGVVLSTIAASARRRELWFAAVACGLAGLLLVANGFLLVV